MSDADLKAKFERALDLLEGFLKINDQDSAVRHTEEVEKFVRENRKPRVILNNDPEWARRLAEDDEGDPISAGGIFARMHNKLCIHCGARHVCNECTDPCPICQACPGFRE